MISDFLSILRRKGWTVAVHNDYKVNGKSMTFWLFTSTVEVSLLTGKADGFYIKGEGETDVEALMQILQKLKLL